MHNFVHMCLRAHARPCNEYQRSVLPVCGVQYLATHTCRRNGRYEAQLHNTVRGPSGYSRSEQVYLGVYKSEEKAARAYDRATLKWGNNVENLNVRFWHAVKTVPCALRVVVLAAFALHCNSIYRQENPRLLDNSGATLSTDLRLRTCHACAAQCLSSSVSNLEA